MDQEAAKAKKMKKAIYEILKATKEANEGRGAKHEIKMKEATKLEMNMKEAKKRSTKMKEQRSVR